MVSWLDELDRREAATREEITELRSQIEGLTRRLADREEVLSRLEITRETMTEILSGDGTDTVAGTGPDVDGSAGGYPSSAGSPVGVRLVPQWEPGLGADVLPRSYRDVVEVLQDAVHPMWAHHLCAVLGLSTDKAKGLFTRGGARRAGAGAPEQEAAADGRRRAGVGPGSRPWRRWCQPNRHCPKTRAR